MRTNATKSRLFLTTALVAVALVSTATEAVAQQITEVRIYAKDLASGDDYAWVNPGDTLVLPQRVEVRLRIEARPANLGPRYPSGRFEDAPSGGKARRADEHRFAGIKGSNPEMGSAVLQTYGRDGQSSIRYTITDNSLTLPGNLRSGTFTVRVDAAAELVASAPEEALPSVEQPGDIDRDTARGLVTELYRGILMREPDADGLNDWSRRIEDRGYPEVIAVAMDIAKSEESRVRIYQNGTTYEQRLGALYEHLLGTEPRYADPGDWRDDLDRLRRGEVEQVVGAMVRSREFRDRFDFPDRGIARRRN